MPRPQPNDAASAKRGFKYRKRDEDDLPRLRPRQQNSASTNDNRARLWRPTDSQSAQDCAFAVRVGNPACSGAIKRSYLQ